MNKISVSKPLKLGDELIIWLPEKHNYATRHGTKIIAHRREKIIFHQVKPGDSLYVIARHYHTSVKKIRRMNRIKNNIIHAGEVLKVVAGRS